MTNRNLKLVKQQPRRRLKVVKPRARTIQLQGQPPQLSPAEQLEAERFKLLTQQRAAHQARVQELAET
ncbi:MAG TPA: hypothetical protein PKD98_00285 [Anaerolineae bacterium]|nr:hypothetical protein [Anaerolineae bacterium]